MNAASSSDRPAKRMRLSGYGLAGLLVAAIIVALVAIVRADDGGGGSAGAPPGASGGGGHVHGLGVNPRDGALFIATHHGLLRAAEGEAHAKPVGESGQDVMGFSVSGPDRFLGSGHPGPLQNLPSNLGLMASSDGGKTFQQVSLLGEADFHVLRSVGNRVFGFDSSNGRLLASRDGGRAWEEHEPPGSVIDLAIDPRAPNHVVASTESGLHASTDGGGAWQKLGDQIVLLGWASPRSLYSLDGEGVVAVSRDGGQTFSRRGRVDGEAVAFEVTANDLYVALADGRVLRSVDQGVAWSERARI